MATKIYKANTGCTFAATAINAALTWTVSRSGSYQRVRSDGDVAARFAYIEDLKCTIQVTAFDTMGGETMKMGSLVLKGYLQDEGLKGTATPVTLTATKATLVSLGDNAVTDGQSPTTLSFELHSTDGTEAGLYTLT